MSVTQGKSLSAHCFLVPYGPPGARTHRSLLLDPTVLIGPDASFGAGGEPALLGPQALSGAASRTSLRKVADGERSRGGFLGGGA